MKNSMKKSLCILLALLFVYTLSACGGSTSKTEGTASTTGTEATASTQADASTTVEKKDPVELTMSLPAAWDTQGIEVWVKYINDNSANLGATVELDKIPDTDQGANLIKTRFATGEAPDILCIQSANYAKVQFGSNVSFADLTGDWTSLYDAESLKSFFFTTNGKLIAAPFDGIIIGGMFYNKKVFSEVGASIPNTWDEFLAVCEKIKAAGKVPVYFSAKDDWSVQLWPMLGFMREFKAAGSSSMMDLLNTNKDKYATKALFKESMAKIVEIKKLGYINKTYLSDTYANAAKAVAEGTAGMYCSATWFADEVKKSYADKVDDIGAFAIPFDGNDALPAWMPRTMMVPADGKNVDVAKNVVMALQTKENLEEYYKAQPCIPFAKGLDVSNLPQMSKEAYDIYMTPGRGYIEFGNLALYGQGANFSKNIQELLIESMTPEQVAQGVDKDVEKSAKAAKDSNWP